MSDVQNIWDDVRGKNASRAAEAAAAAQSESADASIAEQRRQVDFITGLLDPFVQNGMDQSGAVTSGATASGFNENLQNIFNSDAFSAISGEQTNAANNAFSQSGLSRSGGAMEELSQIPTNVALALEDQLYNRQNNLYNSGQNAAAGLGSASQNSTNSITSLLMNQGLTNAQGIIGSAQGQAAGTNNLLPLFGALFSDPRLKENMEPVGKIHDLTLYEWDWKQEFLDIAPPEWPLMTSGYSADEVEEKYPQFIENIGGFKAINYPGLYDLLESRSAA